jgi:hypothetical protein
MPRHEQCHSNRAAIDRLRCARASRGLLVVVHPGRVLESSRARSFWQLASIDRGHAPLLAAWSCDRTGRLPIAARRLASRPVGSRSAMVADGRRTAFVDVGRFDRCVRGTGISAANAGAPANRRCLACRRRSARLFDTGHRCSMARHQPPAPASGGAWRRFRVVTSPAGRLGFDCNISSWHGR